MESSASFRSFVTLRLDSFPSSSLEYKAAKSFCNSVGVDYDDSKLEEGLRLWITSMFLKELSPLSRRRYFEKLSSLYKEYISDKVVENENPFPALKPLLFEFSTDGVAKLNLLCSRLTRLFSLIASDAADHPAIALFLFLLLNASSDISKAIYLTIEDFDISSPSSPSSPSSLSSPSSPSSLLPQLRDILQPEKFHHRRKYLFDLGQSLKRAPQLIRETLSDIGEYLTLKDIRVAKDLSPSDISALWIAKAFAVGIPLQKIAAIVNPLPEAYRFLSIVKAEELTQEDICSIKQRIADAFLPSERRWHALRLRHGVDYKTFKESMMKHLPATFDQTRFFYPVHQLAKKVGRRIVTQDVPLIPDVVFFYTLAKHLRVIDNHLRSANLGWVYRIVNTADSDFSVIDKQSMLNFEQTIGSFTPDMEIELTQKIPLGIGRRVRVTGGLMAGYEGVIYDIKEAVNEGGRQFFIRLSGTDFIKVALNIEEVFLEDLQPRRGDVMVNTGSAPKGATP